LNGIDEQKAPKRLWILAAVTALLLHAGGAALAIVHLQNDDEDDVPGNSTAIEVGLDMATERGESSDLPAGPDSNASLASPQLAEQKAEVKESELPQDKPTEEQEADRAVTPNESKKPKEDDPKIAAVQTQASTESVAAEETAVQRADAPARLARVTWQKELVAHLDKHKRYPSERQQKAAEIQVRFTLDRLGHVLSTSIEKSSGDTAFDEAALAMVRRSDPVPVPPPLVADEGLSFTLPVIFRVKGAKG
jgi:periplasmic protein TonB